MWISDQISLLLFVLICRWGSSSAVVTTLVGYSFYKKISWKESTFQEVLIYSYECEYLLKHPSLMNQRTVFQRGIFL